MDLVYVAVLPPEPLRTELRSLMEQYSGLLGSSRALRNPPHVTLGAPFITKHYGDFVAGLRDAAAELHPFEVELEGLQAFGDRVLFYPVKSAYIRFVHDAVIDVIALHREHRMHKDFNPKLSKRKKELLARYGEMHVKEFYKPHLTLAKSGLDREELQRILAHDAGVLRHSFTAVSIQVLRQVEGSWVLDADIMLTQEEF